MIPRLFSRASRAGKWGRRHLLFILVAALLVACSGGEASPEGPAVPAGEVSDAGAIAVTEAPGMTPSPTLGQEPPTPTMTLPPTDTPEPTPTALPTATATPTLIPVLVNGLPVTNFLIMPEEVRQNVRQIAAAGQALGRNPNTFSILGDSLIATPQSLAQWDQGDYTLGDYDFLQPTIDQYAGSFGRYGVSVRVGLHSWSVFDPIWADKDLCQANEDLLACELRLNNPSVMFIFLGSNDAGSPGGFNVNYRQVVDTLIAQGVVPIMATKADRFEGADNANNTIIRQVAADYQLPLMEFDILADTLPGRGLGSDNIHLTYLEPLDFSNPEILTRGYPVHNLASLMILDEVRREIQSQQN